MKLGERVQIHIGTANLGNALAFYEKLGFQKLGHRLEPYPWAQLTDGQNLLLLSQDGHPYMGLAYFSRQAHQIVADLARHGIFFLQKQEENGIVLMAIFQENNGLMMAIINHDAAQEPVPNGEPLTRCGKFGEFALAVGEMAEAAAYWQNLGFERVYQSDEPYPWGIFNDGQIQLGLHQTTDFRGPALTYFAPNMAERITALKGDGFQFIKEIPNEQGIISNAILKTVDGELIFLFEGEV